jgi:hypothetical protein
MSHSFRRNRPVEVDPEVMGDYVVVVDKGCRRITVEQEVYNNFSHQTETVKRKFRQYVSRVTLKHISTLEEVVFKAFTHQGEVRYSDSRAKGSDLDAGQCVSEMCRMTGMSKTKAQSLLSLTD